MTFAIPSIGKELSDGGVLLGRILSTLYFIFRMRTSIPGVPLSTLPTFEVSVSPK